MTPKAREQEKHALAPPLPIYGAFLLGLATAIAFRVLIIVQHVAPAWARPVGYVAVVGNLAFFSTASASPRSESARWRSTG